MNSNKDKYNYNVAKVIDKYCQRLIRNRDTVEGMTTIIVALTQHTLLVRSQIYICLLSENCKNYLGNVL